jgi:hypothetical protein
MPLDHQQASLQKILSSQKSTKKIIWAVIASMYIWVLITLCQYSHRRKTSRQINLKAVIQ